MNYRQTLPGFNDFTPKIDPLKINLPEYEPGKDPYELLEKQTEYLHNTIPPLEDLANSAKIQADIAVKTSKKADIKGWISVFIAALCAFMEFAVHHSEIIEFIKSILAR